MEKRRNIKRQNIQFSFFFNSLLFSLQIPIATISR